VDAVVRIAPFPKSLVLQVYLRLLSQRRHRNTLRDVTNNAHDVTNVEVGGAAAAARAGNDTNRGQHEDDVMQDQSDVTRDESRDPGVSAAELLVAVEEEVAAQSSTGSMHLATSSTATIESNQYVQPERERSPVPSSFTSASNSGACQWTMGESSAENIASSANDFRSDGDTAGDADNTTTSNAEMAARPSSDLEQQSTNTLGLTPNGVCTTPSAGQTDDARERITMQQQQQQDQKLQALRSENRNRTEHLSALPSATCVLDLAALRPFLLLPGVRLHLQRMPSLSQDHFG
jgi:hypothetical protein